jgi:hypothetical protein
MSGSGTKLPPGPRSGQRSEVNISAKTRNPVAIIASQFFSVFSPLPPRSPVHPPIFLPKIFLPKFVLPAAFRLFRGTLPVPLAVVTRRVIPLAGAQFGHDPVPP